MSVNFLDTFNKECAMANFKFEKAMTLMEMIDKNQEMMYQEAAVFTYVHDRPYSDLVALYEAADKETTDKKKGVLQTIFDAIASIFKSIGNAINKLLDRTKDSNIPNELECSKEQADSIGFINELAGVLKGKDGLNVPGIIKFLTATGAATAGTIFFKNTKIGQKIFGEKNEQNTEGSNNNSIKVSAKAFMDAIKNSKIVSSIMNTIFNKTKDASLNVENKSDETPKSSGGSDEVTEKTVTDSCNVIETILNFIRKCINHMGSIIMNTIQGNKSENGTNPKANNNGKPGDPAPKTETPKNKNDM